MSRAAGKRHMPRDPNTPQPDPGTGEGDYIGVPDPKLPGGRQHIEQAPVEQQKVPAPAHKPTYRGMMAHGVEAAPSHHERTGMSHAKSAAPKPAPVEQVIPVPVFVVEGHQGSKPLRSLSILRIQVPAVGTTPTRIAGEDRDRGLVQLLNEDPSNDIRFSGQITDLLQDPGTTRPVGGAMLPHGMTSYASVNCQTDLYAICTTANTPVISVILETEVKAGR